MRSLLIKVASAFKAESPVIEKDNRGRFKFGSNDKLPNEIVKHVDASGTATSCIQRIQQFTCGSGLVNLELGKSPANREQTFNELLRDLCLVTGYFDSVLLRVLYNNEGQPARVYSESVQKIRRVGESHFVFNELMGEKGYKKTDDVYLQAFDPDETPSERIKRIYSQTKKYGRQYGDLLYIFNKGVGLYRDKYGVPFFYSNLEDIKSDAAISKLDYRNITRGFKTPVIISTGPINSTVPDENGLTDRDKFDNSVKQFAGEDAAIALHLEGSTEESKPTVTTLPINEILDQTDKTKDRIGRAVCRAMSVPPVLVGFETPGQLGNMQELVNSMKLFQLSIQLRQEMISNALTKVFPGKDFTIGELSLFDYIPESVLSRLDTDEVRIIYGIKKPNETTQGTV